MLHNESLEYAKASWCFTPEMADRYWPDKIYGDIHLRVS